MKLCYFRLSHLIFVFYLILFLSFPCSGLVLVWNVSWNALRAVCEDVIYVLHIVSVTFLSVC
jgi:hypothetical protein